ncbi:MAG TPA: metal ABC transporter ATP-binding protein [Dehalococcoidia bacterium]|nr:metal ABC transporter ATP-binding protein [Dehalococcoidia bacterium]
MADSRRETPAIEARNLSAAYGSHTALRDVSFSIERGCLAGLVGPNGSGKSTLLRALLGLHKPYQGEVLLFGQRPQSRRSLIGYMPQLEVVDWSFPVTALEVVLMGRFGRLGLLRRPGKTDREIAMEALQKVGMADHAKRQIGAMSGGQRQRVLLARTLAQEAEILLMDEPFAGLDSGTQHDILSLFNQLSQAGKTLLVATHDLSCVAGSFDHAVFLNRSVVAFGRLPDVFTEEVLNRTFERHLLLVSVEGKVYAAHR